MANKTFTCDVYCPTALESQPYGYLDGQWHDEVLFLLQDKLDEKNSSWFSYENLWKLRVILFLPGVKTFSTFIGYCTCLSCNFNFSTYEF